MDDEDILATDPLAKMGIVFCGLSCVLIGAALTRKALGDIGGWAGFRSQLDKLSPGLDAITTDETLEVPDQLETE